MTQSGRADAAPSAPRRITCARCGAAFDCNLSGDCWCVAEPYRVPMPDDTAADCLCPDCLRQRAASHA